MSMKRVTIQISSLIIVIMFKDQIPCSGFLNLPLCLPVVRPYRSLESEAI